jgi:hypothetical protein
LASPRPEQFKQKSSNRLSRPVIYVHNPCTARAPELWH